MQLVVIKTKDVVYISSNISGASYNRLPLDKYRFDGKLPEATFKQDWYKVESVPSVVEKLVPEKRVNSRYEIKEQFASLNLELLRVCHYDDLFDEDGNLTDFGKNNFAFYETKYDIDPEHWEVVEDVNINIIAEMDKFELVQEKFKLEYNLLDQLNTHPVLLPTKPCKMTLAESYQVIRNYVKENIDTKVAKIESDHDFIFRVSKLIDLVEPEPYQVDVNAWSSRKKTPKYETRYRLNRNVKIFAMSNDKGKSYQGEPLPPIFKGENYEDLQANIKKYLDDLMAIINEPLQDCKFCGGHGVVIKQAQ